MTRRRLWSMAWRNLRRHRARTGFTAAAVFGGVFIMLTMAGLTRGFERLTRDDLVLGRSGALQVHRAGYLALRDHPPLELNMPEAGELAQLIAAVPGVRAVAPRLLFEATLHVREATAICQVRGLDPPYDAAVLPWGHARAGADGGVYVGDRLAARVGAAAGAAVVLQATTATGQIEAADATVAGTFYGGEIEGQQVVEMPLADAQLLVHLPGRVSEFLVRLHDVAALATVRAQLARTLGPAYEVVSWEDLDPNIVDVLRLLNVVVEAVGAVSLLIVCFGIVNSVRMSVYERTREIGTLLALGMRRRAIWEMFLREAVLLASGATTLALAAAFAVQLVVAQQGGVLMAPPGQDYAVYPLLPAIPPLTALVAAVTAVVGAALAAAYPAYRAACLRPVEALQSS